MRVRQVLLLVVSIVGVCGITPAGFLLLFGMSTHEGAAQSRAWAELALVICAVFIVWEVIELRLARRSTGGSIARVAVALGLTALTAGAYVLMRIAMF